MARFHVNMMSYTLRMATDLEVIIPSSPGWSRFVTPTITHKDFPEKFPCLYLLHGFASDYSWFLANTHIPEIAEKQNIAVVMPSGYNTAWEDEKYGLPMSQFLTGELIEFVERMFPISSAPQDRFIAGFSMGKEVPLEAVIEDVLRIPMEFMTVTGYEKGIAGHEIVAIFDNIKVLKPTGNAQYQGFQILMSGKGCRNYENFLQLNEETWFDFFTRVCQYHINFPRIDLAIDDRKPYLSIPDLIVRTKEGLLSSKLREIDFHDSGELKEEVFQSKGGSLYLGSSASNLRLVFYEKGYEQNKKYGTELDENWNRYELRFRQEMAVSVVQELLRYRDVAGLAMEVLNSKIRFLEKPTDSMTTRKRLYPTYRAWAELMKDIGKVKLTMQPQKKSLQKVWEWLEKYVAPSLKLFAEVGKVEQRDYIGNLVKNGEMNITQKQLYDDYIKARRLEERGE